MQDYIIVVFIIIKYRYIQYIIEIISICTYYDIFFADLMVNVYSVYTTLYVYMFCHTFSATILI